MSLKIHIKCTLHKFFPSFFDYFSEWPWLYKGSMILPVRRSLLSMTAMWVGWWNEAEVAAAGGGGSTSAGSPNRKNGSSWISSLRPFCDWILSDKKAVLPKVAPTKNTKHVRAKSATCIIFIPLILFSSFSLKFPLVRFKFWNQIYYAFAAVLAQLLKATSSYPSIIARQLHKRHCMHFIPNVFWGHKLDFACKYLPMCCAIHLNMIEYLLDTVSLSQRSERIMKDFP